MENWIPVGTIHEAKAQGRIWIRYESHRILILEHREHWIAITGLCPHAGAVLKEACIQEGRIQCPYHLWEFSLDSGHCEDPKDGCEALHFYPLQIRGEVLEVQIPKAN
jgi:nitrite reductase/ring-hydroxylating ferredoxin subunit